jgi:arylsulfatase
LVGGSMGGWALYLKDGRPVFCYNLFGIDQTHIRADQPVPAGEHQVRMEFTYDGGGIGKGGTVTLYIDGTKAGEGRVEHTEGIGFGYEYTDVGRDALSPVTDDYPARDNAFTGTIKWIEMEGGKDSYDHLIDPEDILRVAMAKQ